MVEGDEMILFCDGPWLERKCYVDDAGGNAAISDRRTAFAQFRSTVVDGLTQQLDDEMPMVLCGPGKTVTECSTI